MDRIDGTRSGLREVGVHFWETRRAWKLLPLESEALQDVLKGVFSRNYEMYGIRLVKVRCYVSMRDDLTAGACVDHMKTKVKCLTERKQTAQEERECMKKETFQGMIAGRMWFL